MFPKSSCLYDWDGKQPILLVVSIFPPLVCLGSWCRQGITAVAQGCQWVTNGLFFSPRGTVAATTWVRSNNIQEEQVVLDAALQEPLVSSSDGKAHR